MRTSPTILRTTGLATLFLTMLLAGLPHAGATAPAARSAQIAVHTVAGREAVSPATGHLFVLSQDMRSSTAFASAVNMLDARTGRLIHATPVGSFARFLLADDTTRQVFVLKGGLSDSSPHSVALVVLDTRTGAILRAVNLGPGEIQQVRLASRLAQLYVFITPGTVPTGQGPGVLRVLDTKTGATVHVLRLENEDIEFVVDQTASTLFVLNSAGSVARLYNTRTWKEKASVRLEAPQAGMADEAHGLVAIVSGKEHTTITFVSPVTGEVRRTMQLKGSTLVANIVFDDGTDHAFFIGWGDAGKWQRLQDGTAVVGGTDGMVTTVDRASGAVLHAQSVGLAAMRAAVDPSTQHLFVLSLGSIGKSKGRVVINSSLVSVLDTRTGVLLRATKLPLADVLDTTDVVVDGHSGRAYVNAAAGLSQPNSVTLLDTHTGAVVRTVVLPEPVT